MPDDEPLNLLQTSNRPESGSLEPDPSKRRGGMVVLITLCYLAVGSILLVYLVDRPNGIQVFALMAYTFLIPYIASNRFLNFVPWDRLIRGKVLLGHCLALVIVYGVTSEALAVEARLPSLVPYFGPTEPLAFPCLSWGHPFGLGFLRVLLVGGIQG
jgi:hypothetical protein